MKWPKQAYEAKPDQIPSLTRAQKRASFAKRLKPLALHEASISPEG